MTHPFTRDKYRCDGATVRRCDGATVRWCDGATVRGLLIGVAAAVGVGLFTAIALAQALDGGLLRRPSRGVALGLSDTSFASSRTASPFGG